MGSAARLATDVHGLVKPVLRGHIHLAAFVASIPAAGWLVAHASSATARTGAAVYAASVVALFGASAAYHRLGRTERAQRWLRRVDHSTIFLLIAGTYTPICLLALQGTLRWVLLVAVWGVALTGAVLKLVTFDPVRVLGAVLYIALGWVGVLATPQLVQHLPVSSLSLLAVGGVLYTVGAVFLMRRWPDPLPRVFGYHEVWHSLVVVAGVCHYVAVFHVVSGAA